MGKRSPVQPLKGDMPRLGEDPNISPLRGALSTSGPGTGALRTLVADRTLRPGMARAPGTTVGVGHPSDWRWGTDRKDSMSWLLGFAFLNTLRRLGPPPLSGEGRRKLQKLITLIGSWADSSSC